MSAMHTVVIPSSALGANSPDLDLVPAEFNGWKEGRNFALASPTAAHRAAATEFCRGVSTDAIQEMLGSGTDLIALQAKYAGLISQNSRLRDQVRRATS